jgi:hypothetical protein
VIGTGSCDGAGDSYEAFLTDWNLADGNRPIPLQTSSRSGVSLAFSPDGRQMVVGESSPPESTVKSRARIWSLDPPRVPVRSCDVPPLRFPSRNVFCARDLPPHTHTSQRAKRVIIKGIDE